MLEDGDLVDGIKGDYFLFLMIDIDIGKTAAELIFIAISLPILFSNALAVRVKVMILHKHL